MSMSTEDANKYLEQLHASKEEPAKQEEPAQPEAKVEDKEPITPAPAEDKGQEPVTPTEPPENDKGVEQPPKEKPADDKAAEPKVDSDKKDTSPKDDKSNKRDYAFIHEKQKRKEMKKKYETRIAELEKQLADEKAKGLKSTNFKNDDGTPNVDAYLDYRDKQREVQNELDNLRSTNEREQRDFEEREYRHTVESCFPDEAERNEFDKLIDEKGVAFYNALQEDDPNGVILGYLNTVQQYPIVLKELMTNPRKWLPSVFRSRDPDIMKYNMAAVSDKILDEYYAPKAPAAPAAPPAPPIIGKQITSNTVGNTAQTLKTRADWNRYLQEHPKGI